MTEEDAAGKPSPAFIGLAILKREGDLCRAQNDLPCNSFGEIFAEDVVLWKPRWGNGRYLAEPISDKARSVFSEFYVASPMSQIPAQFSVPFKRYWFPPVDGRGKPQGKTRIRNFIAKHGLSVRTD